MPMPPVLKRAIAFLRPDVAIVMAILLVRAATEIHFGGVLEEYDGMGGDGRQHIVIAQELPRVIAERSTTAYHYRHLLPYVTLHAVYRALGLPYNVDRPRSIIVGHQVQNTVFLLIACFVWGRTLERLRIGTEMRWLSFALLFLNFGLVKMPYYHPCNGDSAQFLAGVLMLHAFVTRRYWWLVTVATLGFYVRSGVDIYALALLLFCQPRAGESASRPTPWIGEFVAGAGAIVVGLIAAFYFSPYFWVRVIQPPLGFLRVFSIVIVTAFTFIALYHLLRGFPLATLRRINIVPLGVFLAINIALRTVTNAVAQPPSLLEASELRMLFSSVALGVGKPGIAIVAHVVFFGPAIALLYVLWPQVCRVAREFGPSMVTALGVVVLLGLNSETRVLTTPFPIVVLLVVIVLERLAPPVSFAWITLGIALAWSRVWLSMGAEVPWSRETYPDLLYWIHQGPWMTTPAYLVQGALVAAMIAWFAWCFYASELRGAWGALSAAVRSTEPWAARRAALRSAVAARLDRFGRPAARALAVGWGAVAVVGLIAVPLVFSRLPENAPRLVIEPDPNIVRYGVTTLRLKDASGGMPYLDGVMDIEWKYGFPPEGGRLHFNDFRASATAAYFSRLGDYPVLAKARFKAIPREFVLLNVIRVLGLGPQRPLDFGDDAADDIAWYDTRCGQISIDTFDPNAGSDTIDVIAEPQLNWRPVLFADFTADRHSDLLWHDTAGGGIAIHELLRGTFVSARGLSGAPPGWELVTAAYVDGDSLADLVFLNPATNEVAAHLLRARALPVVQPMNRPRDPEDVLTAVADFSGDGRADLLWHNPETGLVEITVTQEGAVGYDVRLARPAGEALAVVDCQDLDDDGRFEIVWHDRAAGRCAVQGLAAGDAANVDAVTIVPGGLGYLGWGRLVDPNDPNIATAVCYWRGTEQGQVLRSTARGRRLAEFEPQVVADELPAAYAFVRIGDYNGDGSADLLFRNPMTGDALIGFGRSRALEFGWPHGRQRSPEYVLVPAAPRLLGSIARRD